MTPAEAKQAVLIMNEPKQKRTTKKKLFYFFLIRNNKWIISWANSSYHSFDVHMDHIVY